MSVSLIGVMTIQYQWIKKLVHEKQALIDNNIYQSVNTIDGKLNDFRSTSFISDSLITQFDKLLNLDKAIYTNILTDSTTNREIKIISKLDSQNENIPSFEFNHQTNDSIVIIQIEEEIGKADKVFEKIKFELISSNNDSRLDSAKIELLLQQEFETKELPQLVDWSIYDTQEKINIIRPKTIVKSNYTIPLFRSDLISPGRYVLHLSSNTNSLIWTDISIMVLLSLLFLLIMAFVFGYSIRLAIKHKNISLIKSDFINNMTHEFKTPLATISLAADTILHPNTNFNPEITTKYVNLIKDEKTKLNQHVERILEVASLTKATLNIPVQSINTNQIILNSIQEIGLLIHKTNTKVNFDNDSILNAIANPEHLQNVIINIIENSIKYSTNNAHINITTAANTGYVQITISDNGIGMNREQLNHAFDNFFRAESGNIHNTKGFGLGLSYCKLVIEKMDGSISINSTLNKGTVVIIRLKKA